jgi:CO/xanthine dehydrogenase Mo-binding subunit
MNQIANPKFSRRHIMQGAGLLVVSASMPIELRAATAAMSGKPALAPDQLDSFIAIAKNGDVTAYFGKIDGGQGLDVAIGQIVADELDVPVNRVKIVMGDTASRSIRAAPATPRASSKAVRRCATPRPKHAVCWSTWLPSI